LIDRARRARQRKPSTINMSHEIANQPLPERSVLDELLLASYRVEIEIRLPAEQPIQYAVRLAVHSVCCSGVFAQSSDEWYRLAKALEQNQPFAPSCATEPSFEIRNGLLRIRSAAVTEWPVALYGPALAEAIRDNVMPPLEKDLSR
jgi:hypothetical protein